MQSLLPLQDLLRLVIVPVDQGVFRRDRGYYAGGVAALQDLKEPLEIFISPVHIDSGLPSDLLYGLLQPSLDLVQAEAAPTATY